MALFVREHDSFVPTELTTGPWRADAQHGGPPAALLGYSTEALVEPEESIARVGVELVRPVPLEPLTARATRVPVSRRVAHIDATLEAGSIVVAQSRTLVLRGAELPTPGWAPAPLPNWGVPAADAVVHPPTWTVDGAPITFHQDAVEHRMTRGSFTEPGPATSWVRLLTPLIEGEETSPLCITLAAADFGSGISSIYAQTSGVGLINADLTVAFIRPPTGEWVRVSSQTVAGPDIGLCLAELGDEHGPVGTSTQSLLALSV